jgi:hypothetical protein
VSEDVRSDAERYEAEASQYYAEADSQLAQRNAVGFMQNDERGDIARQAGINARQLFVVAQTAVANQANVDRALDMRAARDRARSLEGRLDDEAKIISARGKSIPVRVQQLLEIRTGVAAAQGRTDVQNPMPPEEVVRLRDMIEGEVYATDTSGYYLDYRNSLEQWKASGGTDDQSLGNAYELRAQAFGTMLQRFGDATDRATLERRMRAELTPIFQARYEGYYKQNPSALPKGMSGSAAVRHSNAEALRAVNTSIAQVAKYLDSGESPYADEPPPMPRRESPQARSVSPRFDTQMVE